MTNLNIIETVDIGLVSGNVGLRGIGYAIVSSRRLISTVKQERIYDLYK